MDACAPSSNAPDQPETADLPCPFCAYNLHGITSARCPECGGEIDYAAMSQARIPWEHRRQIGRWRAYWRTVVGFTFKPARWATAGATPRYADAVRFRAVTVGVAFGAILFPMVLLWLIVRRDEFGGDEYAAYDFFRINRLGNYLTEFIRQPASLCITLAGILLALIAITGIPALFFRSASLSIGRQNRAAALAQYTCAALGWLPVTVGSLVVMCALGAWLRSQEIKWGVATAAIVCSALAIGVQMFLWWLATLRILRTTTHAHAGRIISCATFQPLASLVLFVLIPVALQVMAGFLALVVVSLLRN
jgi:hypothetical protein